MSDAPDDAAAAAAVAEAKAARARAKARRTAWAIRLGRPFVELLVRTWRIEEVNPEGWRELQQAGKAWIYCSWHGQLLAHLWAVRHRNLSAMVSENTDGEIISRVMTGWGFRPVRGSSSKGGRRALAEMVRDLTAGMPSAITPDGPRGPAGVPAPGVLVAALKSGAPIVPIRSEVSRAWRTNSWDRFEVPKPFARVRVIYGDPWMPTAVDDANLAELVRRMHPAHATLMPPVARRDTAKRAART